ncbi:MAG: hypothetical protein JXK05_03715 [Campylobacterales bacterium]|nr:hypothetical protein [Campylobacterales bacterium]
MASIEQQSVERQKQELEVLLASLTAPAMLVREGRVMVTTGRFATQAQAERLLPLTQTRYPEAFVLSCDDAVAYKSDQGLQSATVPKRSLRPLYAIKMLELSMQEAQRRASEIESHMANVPYASKQTHQDRLYLLGGRFEQRDDAELVLTLIQRRYPQAVIVTIEPSSVQPPVAPLIGGERQTVAAKQTSNQPEDRPGVQEKSLTCNGLISVVLRSDTLEGEQLFEGMASQQRILASAQEEPFYGFYLRSNTAWDTLNNDAAYDIRVEWELFDQGYYHARKLQEKERLDQQIALYRMLDQVRKLSQQSVLEGISRYQNAVEAYELIERLKIQESYLNRMQARYEARMATQFEYDMLRFEIDKEKEMLRRFHHLKLVKMPQALWQLVNQIEYVRLRQADRIVAQRAAQGKDQEEIETMAQRAQMHSDWSDKLQLSLYAGQRKMYLSQHQSIVGVEAKIPLTFGDATDERERTYYTMMAHQVSMQTRLEEEKLREMTSRFAYAQQRLMTLRNEIERLERHAVTLERVHELGYGELVQVGSEELYRLRLSLHTKHTAMQKERLALYALLVEILFTAQADSISDLLEYALPDYADHRAERR